jgi:hypothetical protein
MTSLSDTEIQALHDALNDEYHAWAVYYQVLKDFGPVRPFLNIRDSELRHIEALQHLFRFYNLPIPINPGNGTGAALPGCPCLLKRQPGQEQAPGERSRGPSADPE